MIIAVDFDGTCVFNDFPKIGESVPECLDVLHELIKNKNKLILYTVRDGKHLTAAVEWFANHNIKLYGINHNPQQDSWSKSRKLYFDFLIDDRALGCPLKIQKTLSKKPFVDWKRVRELLKEKGVL